jgi:hypothetical protein
MIKIKTSLLIFLIANKVLCGEAIKASYTEVDWQVEKQECYGEYDPFWDRQNYPKNPILLKKIYSDGTLHMSVPCFKGKLNGMQKRYYKSGKIQSEIPFKNNLRDGKTIFYHKDGNISKIEFVKNGYIDGYSTYYFPDGSIQGECFYKDGLQEGRCYILNINVDTKKKELRSEVNYIHGVKKGLEIASQGAIFTGFTTISYRKGEMEYEDSLSIFRRSKKFLSISIKKKRIKSNKKIRECVFSWYERRSELFAKSKKLIQKDLKEECFSDRGL